MERFSKRVETFSVTNQGAESYGKAGNESAGRKRTASDCAETAKVRKTMRRIKKNLRPGLFALGLALTLGASGAARAQDGDSYAVGDEGTRPAQTRSDNNTLENEPADANAQAQGPVRLARFSFIEGTVTWREDESAAWTDAGVNLPVRQGAQIFVAAHGRAEIQFDDGSLLRLGSGALVTLQTLYSDTEGEFTEIKLSEGLASLRTRNDRSVYQIDTPYVSVKTTGKSKLRVGAGETVEAAVTQGDATVEGSQGRADLHKGDYLSLDNPDAAFAIRRLPRADSWERWNEERDAYLEGAAERPASRHLPSNIAIVAPDLDEYGNVARRPGLRLRVVSPRGGGRLAPLQRRALDVGSAVRVDMGFQRGVGLGAVPLWNVGASQLWLGLVSRPGHAVLVARCCAFFGIQRRRGMVSSGPT